MGAELRRRGEKKQISIYGEAESAAKWRTIDSWSAVKEAENKNRRLELSVFLQGHNFYSMLRG
jgi:hypothetical protein